MKNLSNDWGELYTKKLETDIPSIWYQKYSECVPSLDPDNLDRAFLKSVNLACELFEYHKSEKGLVDILSRIKNKV